MQSAIFIERPDGIPACARFSDCLPPNQPLERCQWHVGDRLPQLVVIFLDRSRRQYVLDTSHSTRQGQRPQPNLSGVSRPLSAPPQAGESRAMTATAGYLFEGADWEFEKLQRIHDACEPHLHAKFQLFLNQKTRASP